MRVHNFSAGPAQLPLPVLERAAAELTDWRGTGMSVLEDSHRGKDFVACAAATEAAFRRVAALPDNRMLRFQTALALYRNNEMIAAKEQLQKLRSSDVSEADRKALDEYIAAIDRRDQWSFNGSLSYVHDNNVNGVAKKGTRLELGNGRTFTASREQEKANGISYSIGADKKWSLSDNLYSSLHGDISGVYYYNNKNYNDITAHLDNRNATTKLSHALLKLLFVVIARSLGDLSFDLRNARVDIFFLARTAYDSGVIFVDHDTLGLSEISHRSAF